MHFCPTDNQIHEVVKDTINDLSRVVENSFGQITEDVIDYLASSDLPSDVKGLIEDYAICDEDDFDMRLQDISFIKEIEEKLGNQPNFKEICDV